MNDIKISFCCSWGISKIFFLFYRCEEWKPVRENNVYLQNIIKLDLHCCTLEKDTQFIPVFFLFYLFFSSNCIGVRLYFIQSVVFFNTCGYCFRNVHALWICDMVTEFQWNLTMLFSCKWNFICIIFVSSISVNKIYSNKNVCYLLESTLG